MSGQAIDNAKQLRIGARDQAGDEIFFNGQIDDVRVYARSLRYLLDSENVNVKQPERSRLLLKPLNEIKHGGGQKMLAGDMTYKAFRAFLDDYAKTVNDRYVAAADLPKSKSSPTLFGSDVWLKLNNTPPEWADKLLQLTLFAWDESNNSWETEPIALSDRGVWGKGKLWQHNLALLARKDSERARQWTESKPSLPAGRYLLKVHVDAKERLKSDRDATLSDSESVGEAVVESNSCAQPDHRDGDAKRW